MWLRVASDVGLGTMVMAERPTMASTLINAHITDMIKSGLMASSALSYHIKYPVCERFFCD
jgi:hypothetical protein